MNPDYWLRQSGQPLYPQLEWSRPENKSQAGKLLIIGGTGQGFAAPAEAYTAAMRANIGVIRVLLPDSLRRSVSKLFPEAEFAPSNLSGSFATSSLAELCGASTWADAVLFPGDLSRNSETTVLLENFLEKCRAPVTITRDAADLLCQQPHSILHRPDTLLVLAMGQLQRLGVEAHFPRAFTSDMGLLRLTENLHEFTRRFTPYIITKYQDQLVVAVQGEVSTTPFQADQPVWRLQAAASAAVWWLQNPSKPFAALSTAAWDLTRRGK